MRLPWSSMTAWSLQLLGAAGLPDDMARPVADNLEYAARRGFTSHGFMRLPTYVSRIQTGGINRTARLAVLDESPAVTVVDADGAAGAFSATTCVDLVIAKAGASGAAVVFARNANHFGAAGYYTDAIASAGFFGIALSNTDAVMCPPFGGRAVLGTNPISMAAPITGGAGPLLDMATSEGNYGKILHARDHGEQIPTGWAVDAAGTMTTDPMAGLGGALLPSGGPKGFGLAFMVDCLVAAGGALTSNEVSALYGDTAARQMLGHVFIAIAVDRAQTASDYTTRVAALTAAVHSSRTSGSTRPPMVPGEPERHQLAAATDWQVDDPTLREFQRLSSELRVPIPESAAAVLARLEGAA